MRELIASAIKLLKEKSFRRYLFVGFSTVFIDLFILVLLREHFGGGIFSAVSIAYWLSIAYNFFMNRHWSFEAGHGVAPKQMTQYGILLGFNYLTTLAIVSSIESAGVSEYIGKVIALCVTISWTYVIYKKVIFKP